MQVQEHTWVKRKANGSLARWESIGSIPPLVVQAVRIGRGYRYAANAGPRYIETFDTLEAAQAAAEASGRTD